MTARRGRHGLAACIRLCSCLRTLMRSCPLPCAAPRFKRSIPGVMAAMCGAMSAYYIFNLLTIPSVPTKAGHRGGTDASKAPRKLRHA